MSKRLEEFEDSWGTGYEDPNMQDTEQEVPMTPKENALNVLDDLKQLGDIDSQFEKIYRDVISADTDMQIFSSNIQRLEINNLNTIVSNVKIKDSGTDELDEATKDLNQLLNTDSQDILKLFNDNNIHNNRKKLYDLYNEIAEINPIAYRMLKVYVDNILVKNMQTKQFLNIVDNEQNNKTEQLEENIKKIVKSFFKTVLVYFDIQTKLKNNILPNTLKHGDYYLEIVDLSPISRIVENKMELIQESITIPTATGRTTHKVNMGIIEFPSKLEGVQESYSLDPENHNASERLASLLGNKKSIEEADINFLNDIMNLEKEENPEKDNTFNFEQFQNLNFDSLKEVHLRLIEPSSVIKIEMDGINFGYLVIEDIKEKEEGEEINLYQRFMSDDGNKTQNTKNVDITKEVTDKFTKEIISKVSDHIGKDSTYIDQLPEELSLSLKVILYQKIKERSKLKFRFLEPDDLINFHTNVDKFAPYGTSIFDSIVLPVKLYTIALMASVISRLSRASVVRKWNIEVGNRRNHSQIVQNVQKELKTKNITYDDLNSMKNISQVMTDFRDIATVSKNGQRFIDLELMPAQDRSLPLNDLQDLRNELIAATGIPSVYLNIGDNTELRETLVNLNIGFANTIAGYQGYMEDAINNLFNSIFQIILKNNNYDYKNFNISQYFKVAINPPLVLQLQNNEAIISTISNIIGTLSQAQVNVDPIELFEMYAPSINWKKIQKSGETEIKEKIKEQLMQQQSQPQQ
jgi:hypothetical protein